MNFRTTLTLCAAAVALATAGSANAAAIIGNGQPSGNAAFAAGSKVMDFNVANQSFSSYSLNGITISAGEITNFYSNSYNTYQSSYDNNAGNLNTISFSFAAPTSAFAFNWGAADVIWDMNVFSGASLLGSVALTPTSGGNSKTYYGYSGTNITSAVLTARSGGDFVFVDNLTVANAAAVPEPATWAMMLVGFGMVGAAMRQKKKQPAKVRFAF